MSYHIDDTRQTITCFAILPRYNRLKKHYSQHQGDLSRVATKTCERDSLTVSEIPYTSESTDVSVTEEQVFCQNHQYENQNFCANSRIFDDETEEVRQLLDTCHFRLTQIFYPYIYNINPGYFFKKGFLETVKKALHCDSISNCEGYLNNEFDNETCKEKRKDYCIYTDCELSAIQLRNLEKYFDCKIYTRKALIIKIFSQRARSSAGKLQVSLAQLTLEKTRLVHSWTHLERQRGGKGSRGFLSGPGEKQIEIDRRIITQKIDRIKERLQKLGKSYAVQRKSRRKNVLPIIALVGYTNVGKSTLFNHFVDEQIYVQDQLFATLDTTMRKCVLPQKTHILVSDTVGFISRLPPELINAFRETLNEITLATIILHVRDIACANSEQQARDVMTILKSLGISNDNYTIIEVWNKVDKLSQEKIRELECFQDNKHILMCAKDKSYLHKLRQLLEETLCSRDNYYLLRVPLNDYSKIHWLYKHCLIVNNENDEFSQVICLSVYVKERYSQEFHHKFSDCIA